MSISSNFGFQIDSSVCWELVMPLKQVKIFQWNCRFKETKLVYLFIAQGDATHFEKLMNELDAKLLLEPVFLKAAEFGIEFEFMFI